MVVDCGFVVVIRVADGGGVPRERERGDREEEFVGRSKCKKRRRGRERQKVNRVE